MYILLESFEFLHIHSDLALILLDFVKIYIDIIYIYIYNSKYDFSGMKFVHFLFTGGKENAFYHRHRTRKNHCS